MAFVAVAKTGDLPAGSMKEVTVQPGNDASSVLLVHSSSGKWFATSPKCTHYGAPLAKGSLVGDKVVCPWHGACFSCASGDIEDAPALDRLHTYEVVVEGDDVKVSVPPVWPSNFRRPADVSGGDVGSGKRIVIVGGGAAGAVAVQTVREAGWGGEVVLVTAEAHLPYDRVKLSKAPGVGVEALLLRDAAWFEGAGVEVRTGSRVASVDVGTKTLVLAGGSTLTYDGLLLATGSTANHVGAASDVSTGVHVLRTPEDAAALSAGVGQGKDKNVVVIGSSFIGVEYAAAAAANGIAKSITVIGKSTPFERVLGAEIGALVQATLEAKGVVFEQRGRAASFHTTATGSVSGVELSNGNVVPADVVLQGVGAKPGVPELTGATIAVNKDGSVNTDDHFKLLASEGGPPVPNVWAAGDVARFPYHGASGAPVRIEHWDVAQQQGRVAARDMVAVLVGSGSGAAAGSGAGATSGAYSSVPFFWTALAGVGNIRYTGVVHAGYDEIVFDGGNAPTLEAPSFVAYYCKDGEVVAVATLGRDPVSTNAQALLAAGTMPSAAEFKSGAASADGLAALVAKL